MRQVRELMTAAMSDSTSAGEAAERLCDACVDLLDVDSASLSLVEHGVLRGIFASSGALARRAEELQFTFGEGPCLDAVASGRPVLVPDLTHDQRRWPALGRALAADGVGAVFALPVFLTDENVGALDLYRRTQGALTAGDLAGALVAAELAALPLLDVLAPHGPTGAAVDPGSLQRVEVYQATGMIVAALEVDADDALLRLRARAWALGTTAHALAREIVERRVLLDGDDWCDGRTA